MLIVEDFYYNLCKFVKAIDSQRDKSLKIMVGSASDISVATILLDI